MSILFNLAALHNYNLQNILVLDKPPNCRQIVIANIRKIVNSKSAIKRVKSAKLDI